MFIYHIMGRLICYHIMTDIGKFTFVISVLKDSEIQIKHIFETSYVQIAKCYRVRIMAIVVQNPYHNIGNILFRIFDHPKGIISHQIDITDFFQN